MEKSTALEAICLLAVLAVYHLLLFLGFLYLFCLLFGHTPSPMLTIMSPVIPSFCPFSNSPQTPYKIVGVSVSHLDMSLIDHIIPEHLPVLSLPFITIAPMNKWIL